MNNNNFYNTGYVNGQMYGQAPVNQMPQMVNPLTDEEWEALKVDNSFTLLVTPADMAEAVCTHKNPKNGQFATVDNPDGTVTCTICHQTFNPNLLDEKYVQDTVDNMINILESCKYLCIDTNPDIIRGFFQMIPFLKKTPQLYKLGHQAFMRYLANVQQGVNPTGPNYMSALNMLTNPAIPLGGPYSQNYGYQYAQQPQQGMGMPAYGQPMMTPTQQMQAQSMPAQGANPFYAAPAVQPGMMGANPMPQAPQAANSQNAMTMNPPEYQTPQGANNTEGTVQVKDTVQL